MNRPAMDIIPYDSRAALAAGLAAAVAAQLRAALEGRGRASLALPGGTTPAPFLEALSGQPLDWARVTVFPADERWVPADHPRSNAALIRAHLIRGRAARARVVDLYQPGAATPAEAEDAVAARLQGLLPPDVLVLGMGEDLHTASLFPGAPRIAQALAADAPPVMAMEGPAPGREPRLSLTGPVLAGARAAHLLVTGAGKRAALDRLAALPPGTDPATAPVLVMLPFLTIHWAA